MYSINIYLLSFRVVYLNLQQRPLTRSADKEISKYWAIKTAKILKSQESAIALTYIFCFQVVYLNLQLRPLTRSADKQISKYWHIKTAKITKLQESAEQQLTRPENASPITS